MGNITFFSIYLNLHGEMGVFPPVEENNSYLTAGIFFLNRTGEYYTVVTTIARVRT